MYSAGHTTNSVSMLLFITELWLTAGSLSWTLTPGTSGTGLVLRGLSALPPGRSPISSHAAGWGHDCSEKNRIQLGRMKQKRVVGLFTSRFPSCSTESRGQNVRTQSTFVNANISSHLRWDTDRQLPPNSGQQKFICIKASMLHLTLVGSIIGPWWTLPTSRHCPSSLTLPPSPRRKCHHWSMGWRALWLTQRGRIPWTALCSSSDCQPL